jgi:uncharacterized protein with HEPN domain
MSRVNELFLFDIFVAILKIRQTVNNKIDANALKYDYMAWDSVIREFEIIGEATKHLIESDILDQSKRSIVNFRNVLIHEYFGIDEEEVYDIAKNRLEELESIIIDKILIIEQSLKDELLEDIINENKHLEFVVKSLSSLEKKNI